MLAASAYNTKKTVLATTYILIFGFTRNSRSWWHNQLTNQDRSAILTATKAIVKQEGNPQAGTGCPYGSCY